jgi:hypothetical protein
MELRYAQSRTAVRDWPIWKLHLQVVFLGLSQRHLYVVFYHLDMDMRATMMPLQLALPLLAFA